MILRSLAPPLTVLLAILITTGIQSASAQTTTTTGNQRQAGYRTVIIPADSGTWGYDIMKDGKLLIHQPGIPALAGNTGFRDKASAERTASLVIQKLERGQMPPTLTVDEVENAISSSRPK